VLAGEACVGAVLADRRGSNRERTGQEPHRLHDFADRAVLPGGDRLGQFASERDSGRGRKTRACRLSEADGFRAEDCLVMRAG
jgi:hypothetical protein